MRALHFCAEPARPPPRRSLRLFLDTSLLTSSGIATAVTQLFTQMPPLVGTNALPAEELAELFLGPGPWQLHALRGLQMTPRFWQMQCQFFGIRGPGGCLHWGKSLRPARAPWRPPGGQERRRPLPGPCCIMSVRFWFTSSSRPSAMEGPGPAHQNLRPG